MIDLSKFFPAENFPLIRYIWKSTDLALYVLFKFCIAYENFLTVKASFMVNPFLHYFALLQVRLILKGPIQVCVFLQVFGTMLENQTIYSWHYIPPCTLGLLVALIVGVVAAAILGLILCSVVLYIVHVKRNKKKICGNGRCSDPYCRLS